MECELYVLGDGMLQCGNCGCVVESVQESCPVCGAIVSGVVDEGDCDGACE